MVITHSRSYTPAWYGPYFRAFLRSETRDRLTVLLASVAQPELSPTTSAGSVYVGFRHLAGRPPRRSSSPSPRRTLVFAVGLVTCAQFTSPLVLGPFAGALDRQVRRAATLLGLSSRRRRRGRRWRSLEFAGPINSEWPLVCGALLERTGLHVCPAGRNVTVRRLVPGADSVRPAFAMDSVSSTT